MDYLDYNGVRFPPPYNPHGVKMLYKGNPVDLTPEQEEVATLYARMMNTIGDKSETFLENFMNDWRKLLGENHIIQNFGDCDFTPIYEWHQREKEKWRQMSTEEIAALKEEQFILAENYKWAIVDGVRRELKEMRHDNTAQWLAYWKDPINPERYHMSFLPRHQGRVTRRKRPWSDMKSEGEAMKW